MLIGSHDSGAYMFNSFLGKMFSPAAKTQTLSIKQQAEAGIRLFDLRVAYSNHKFYLAHTFLCEELRRELLEIKISAKEHPDEIYVVNIRADRWHEKQFAANKIATALKLEVLYYLDLPNIILNTNKGVLKNLFPTAYQEIGAGANSVNDIHKWISGSDVTQKSYVSFTVAATLWNLTKMLLTGNTLISMGRKARAVFKEEQLPDNVIGVMFDGV